MLTEHAWLRRKRRVGRRSGWVTRVVNWLSRLVRRRSAHFLELVRSFLRETSGV
ncbi:MAG: hypothetical protein M3300_09205 [Actinomycetota bacterium]|nr:hypothetical protein [Actinomycetota bacterium]